LSQGGAAAKPELEPQQRLPPSAPAATGPSAAATKPATDILNWSRFIVRNLVPLASKLDDPANPGVMLADTKFKHIYDCPCQLVWLHDVAASNTREAKPDLPPHLRPFPVLPHWMMCTNGNNECIPRACMLADGGSVAEEDIESDWPQHILQLERDSVDGSAVSVEEEAKLLAEYRNE